MVNSIVVSQNDNTSVVRSVSIITAQINFIDTVIVGYEPGHTMIYPTKFYPIHKLHYGCNLTIKLSGENFIIDEPFVVKCFLPNNAFQTVTLNNERFIMTSDQFYYFNFDIYSDNKLIGWTTLELDKDESNEENGQQIENNIRYDKETLYIN
jgi:hypothetical protein